MAEKIYMGAAIGLDGEKEFKKAVSSINSDTRVLASEMKKVTSAYNENSNSLEALQKKDIVLNKQLDAQKKKVETLRSALKNAQETYGENDTRVDKWKISLNNAEAQMSKLDSELKTNNRYMDEAKRSTDKTATSIDKFGKEVKTTEGKTSMFGDVLKANLTTTAIVGGIKTLASEARQLGEALKGCATDAMTYADDMLTLSAQTGISTDKLQRYNYMSELVDVSVETITGSMKKNIKSMDNASQGSERYANAYKKLGVSVTDSNGKLRDSESVYWDVIDALGSMKNSTERDATSMQLFGKSAQDLNPMIQRGASGMKELSDEADRMGAVMSGDTLSALGEADDASQRMNQSLEILKRQIGVKLAPEVEKLSEELTDFAQEHGDDIAELVKDGVNKLKDGIQFCIDNAEELKVVAGGLVGAFAFSKILSGVSSVVTSVKTITTAVSGLKAAQTATEGTATTLMSSMKGGLIGLGVTAAVATTAYLVLSDSETEAQKQARILTDEQKKFKKEVDESYKSFMESSKAIRDNNEAVKSNYDGAEALLAQLDEIVDKNGKIKKSYETRAGIIANELKESYGIEIDIVDGTIKKYGELKDSIDKLMEKKKAQALLDANNAEYIKAVEGSSASEKQARAAVQKYNKTSSEVAKLQESYKKAKRAKDDFENQSGPKSQGTLIKLQQEKTVAEDKLKKLKVTQSEERAEVAKTQEKYKEYQKTIIKYEELQKAALSGNKKEMKRATKVWLGEIAFATTEGANRLKASKGLYSEAQFELFKSASKKANAQYFIDKMGEIGENGADAFSNKFITHLSQGEKGLKKAFEDVLSRTRSTLDIHSPSRKFQYIGEMTGKGFEKGTIKSLQRANSAIQSEFTKATQMRTTLVTQNANPVATSQQSPSDIVDAISGAMSGDLNITLTLDGKSVFESSYKEFRKRKTADPTLSLA